jgi:ubiquinone/menaquinone biosynthesis C-methylase UbiE
MKANKYFDEMYIQLQERATIWSALAEYVQHDIGKPNTILELGAGYCNFINNISAKHKIALDTNSSSKKYANKDVKFHTGKCNKLKFISSNSIDVVFASNLLEHLSSTELEELFSELRRIVKKKGKIVILQPNFYYAYREYFHDYTHKTIFTHVSMCDLLSANGFNPIKIKPKLLPFSMQSKYSGQPLPKILFSKFIIKLYLHSPIKPFARQMYIVAEKTR